jgi:hypothetical protein
MGTLALKADERVASVKFTDEFLVVDLRDGRQISVPLVWYPRLAGANSAALLNWEVCGGGYGLHWPDLDEDLSTEGLLRGAPAPDA